MQRRRNSALLLLLLAVAGCAVQTTPPITHAAHEGIKAAWAQTDGIQYRCAEDRSFVANFSPDATHAAIKLGEAVYALPRVESGSGIHYKSDKIDFIGKGRDAQLLVSPNGPYTACRAVDTL